MDARAAALRRVWWLMAGSLAPYWDGYYSLHHFTFTDATGAEYRLDQNNGGVWTSSEGTYVSYDSNARRLYFPDGSFWVMGCSSWGFEQDSGTVYPTQMEDTNGNQILVRYGPAVYISAANTSSRISEIEDVRAVYNSTTGTYQSYSFTYNSDSIPHLTQINNSIQKGAESYTLSYLENRSLSSPWGSAFGATTLLQSSAITGLGIGHSFQYDPSGSGELTQVWLPYGGSMRWKYRSFPYQGSRTLRELQDRYLTKDVGAAETTYTFAHDDATDAGLSVHSWTTLDDPSGVGQKAWYFGTAGAGWQLGLLTRYEDRPSASQASQPLQRKDFTWVQAGNPYIGTALTTLDPATANVQTKTEQTLDTHGNVTQTNIYGYCNLTTPGRTYTNAYLVDSRYTDRYIFNRLLTSTVTSNAVCGASSQSVRLVTNTYDATPLGNLSGQREHDTANYGTAFVLRGNVTKTVRPGATVNKAYDITGTVTSTDNGLGYSVAVSRNASTNYAAPSALTPNSNANLASSMSYSPFLGITSLTEPNNAQSTISYDTYGRRATSTVPYGAVTSYTYTYNPATVTATVDGRWVKTTLDGLGRANKVEKGDGTGTKSVVDTEYDSCACSPLGKVKRVSQSHLPGGTQYWTTYSYDGLGRTLSVGSPDGASTTTYAYSGNQTTVTDPAGKWKTFTTDAMGNLTKVTEPNPQGGSNLDTLYTYDVLNHLTQVSMTRGTATQTRTFAYDSNQRLQSVTHPENGTVTYTYNADGTLATKVDFKNQKVIYSYDSYQRLVAITRYPVAGGQADLCQLVVFTYDQNVIGYLNNAVWGRLAAVQWGDPNTGACPTMGGRFTEMYAYYSSGLVSQKRLQLERVVVPGEPALSGYLEASFGYDNEGRVIKYIYPSDWPDMYNTNYYYTVAYDSLGRPNQLSQYRYNYPYADSKVGDWVKDVTYGPADELAGMSYRTSGSTWWNETRQYNSRRQLTRLTASGAGLPSVDLEYRYLATQNNGQIRQAKDWISGEEVTYTYDALQRLITAQTTGSQWGLSFSYDGFGNRTAQSITQGTAPSQTLNIDPATNRVTTAGYSYDANGNVTAMPTFTNMAYDVENRLVAINGDEYTYSATNQRVRKQQNGAQEEIYFYGVAGEKLGTYQVSAGTSLQFVMVSKNLYFGGRLLGTQPRAVTPWLAATVVDRLGSVRADAAGETLRYYPFGEEYTTTTQNREKFATYYRDGTTGLDYANNRYYSSIQGRFLTPDPYRASGGPAEPGSWNRYAYVKGDPVNFNDPNGTFCVALGSVVGDPWPSGDGCLQLIASDSDAPARGGGGGDLLDCYGNEFDSTPNPLCYLAAQPLLPPPPPRPQFCIVSLFGQSAVFPGDPFGHTYTEVWFVGQSAAQEQFLEGEPRPKDPNDIAGRLGPQWLNGFNTTGHPLSANNATPLWSSPELQGACDQLISLEASYEKYYNNTITYNNWYPWSGPTSNSWTHSLLLAAGIAGTPNLSNTTYPGWSNTGVPFP